MSVTIVLLYLLAALLACYFLAYKIKRWKYETLGEKIPGPRAYPLVGNTLLFTGIQNTVDLWCLLMKLLKVYSKDYGQTFRVWIGPMLVVLVTDLKDINTLLSTPHAATKHKWYVKILRFMTSGIFGLNGKDWHDLRKTFIRYFSIKKIESYMGVFEAKSLQLASKAEKKIGTGVFNVHDLVKFYPLDTVCATHLGAENMNEMDENRHDFHHYLEKSLEITFTRALRPEYLIDAIYKMSKLGRENEKVDYEINSISRRIVQQRLDSLKSRGIDLNSEFEEEYYTDTIIKKGVKQNWTINEMGLAITDVVVGGSDTTALAIAYTLLCLATHPEYQERAYQEQLDMFGESERLPTFKETQGMPFLTMCYKEVVRLYGGVGIARELTDDFQLGDYLIPNGTGIFLLFYHVHRNPAYYSRPNDFYPDHFSAEACSLRPKQSFFSFSAGSRGCPGSLYSNISSKLALSLLIRKFRFSSPVKYSDLKFRFSLMLENIDGYPVEIHRRTNRETA